MKNSSGVVVLNDFLNLKSREDVLSRKTDIPGIAKDTGTVRSIVGPKFDATKRFQVGSSPNLFQETGMVREWLAAGESVASRCFLYR